MSLLFSIYWNRSIRSAMRLSSTLVDWVSELSILALELSVTWLYDMRWNVVPIIRIVATITGTNTITKSHITGMCFIAVFRPVPFPPISFLLPILNQKQITVSFIRISCIQDLAAVPAERGMTVGMLVQPCGIMVCQHPQARFPIRSHAD